LGLRKGRSPKRIRQETQKGRQDAKMICNDPKKKKKKKKKVKREQDEGKERITSAERTRVRSFDQPEYKAFDNVCVPGDSKVCFFLSNKHFTGEMST
jgi:hypothetical protein